MIIRASIGTLAKAGLTKIDMDAEPTTAYLLQHCEKCLANCAFCDLSKGINRIARVIWPDVELEHLLPKLKLFDRVCIQNVLKKGWVEELIEIVKTVEGYAKAISVALTPVSTEVLRELAKHCDYVGVGLDAPTPRTFRLVGKPFTWSTYTEFIRKCVEVFGAKKVFVHLIAGLGDSVEEILDAMRLLYRMGCRIALFSYTPSKYHRFPGIDVASYRFLQVARQCLEEGIDPKPLVEVRGSIPRFRVPPAISDPLKAVLTSGCPACNRPFYNESPRGPIMNFPSYEMVLRMKNSVIKELSSIGAL